MNIKKVLQSGEVVRFHNHAGVDKQPTANHQWGVALIVNFIEPSASKELTLAALVHDVGEYVTGDLPAPVKWAHPSIKELFDMMEERTLEEYGVSYMLTAKEKMALRIADRLEGMWFCIQQLKLGHISARRPYRKWKGVIDDMVVNGDYAPTGEFHEFYNMLEEERIKWGGKDEGK